jgi:uncharacterized protein YfaS (alpha-2-macroglobulin family)
MRRFGFIVVACAFVLAGCQSGPDAAKSAASPLAVVTAVAFPTLPPMIRDVSPRDEAEKRTQVRVRFTNDLVPVEALDAPDAAAVIAHFRIAPEIGGRFRLLTPRMVAFEADAPLPLSSRFAVTVTAGLADRTGATLASDLTWTFATTPLAFKSVPDTKDAGPTGLTPDLRVTANMPFDAASFAAHAALVAPDGTRIGIAPKTDAPASGSPSAAPSATASAPEGDAPDDPAADTAVFTPVQPLAKRTVYAFTIDSGVMPKYGNLATQEANATGDVTTYGPLTLDAVVGYGAPTPPDMIASARFASGTPQLRFSTEVTIASALAAIRVAPAPIAGRALFAGSGSSRTIALDPYALAPATSYTITVDPSITDVFGQHLDARATQTFATGRLATDLWAPTGFAIFRAGDDVVLRASATNLPNDAYRATFAAVRPIDLIYGQNIDPDQDALVPPIAKWQAHTLAAKPDVATPIDIPLGSATGLFAYGFSYRQPGVKAPTAVTGLVQKTNLGVFAQYFPARGVVRVERLSDGAPVAGAAITIYPSLAAAADRGKTYEPCAHGTTDANGTLEIAGAAFASCELANAGDHQAPALLAIAESGGDWAYARTDSYSNGYATGGDGTWTNGTPLARGELFSDRSLYQPGEHLALTGVAYFLRDGVLARGAAASYAVTMTAPSGAVIALGTAVPDAYGAFSVTYDVPRTAELGTYAVRAKGGNEELDGTLRVAEFKPPNFAVKLALDGANVAAGTTVTATTTSTYLFGGAVAGGGTRTFATRSAASYAPKGYDDYQFGRQYFYPDVQPQIDPNVLETHATDGADGIVRQPIAVPTDLPFPMTYSVDAETTDASNLTVSDDATFTAFPTDATIGLKTGFTGAANAKLPIDLVVLGLDGKPLAGRTVHVALERATYASKTHTVEGSEQTDTTVSYAETAHADVTSGLAPVHAELTPTQGGTYRVRATFAGADERSASDAEVWVAGPGEASWGGTDPGAITVKLDRPTYRVGDTVHALAALPYAGADVTFSVVKGDQLLTQRTHVDGTSASASFTVTEAMLPNAAVQAFVVRRSGVRAGDATAEAKKLAGVGFAAFHVDLAGKRMQLGLAPRDAVTHPGATQHLHVHLVDAAKAPVAGEVVVAVVDEAILQLSGYRFPDLVADIYADQPIAQRYADNRADVQLVVPHETVEKGWGFGGGVGAGAAGTRVRTKFVPLAYYRGDVHTDANGDADVSFTLPDALTTWRALAIGLSRDARFATADATFVSSTALATNAVLPQFARIGDVFDGGVTVTSPQRVGASVTVAGSVKGGAAFVNGTSTSATQSTTANLAQATQAFRAPILVTSAIPPLFTFSSTLGDAHDALTADLPIRTQDVAENVVVTGRAQAATQAIAIDPKAADPSIDVTVSTNIVGDLHAPLKVLLDDDATWGDAVASRIAAAADLAMLRTADPALLAPIDPARRAAAELAQLDRLARANGSYREFAGDDFGSASLDAYVLTALARAHAAGIDVGARLASVKAAVERELADPARDGSCGKDAVDCRNDVRVDALAALADAGDVRSTFLADLFEARAKLSLSRKYALALQLTRVPAMHDAAATMRRELGEGTYLTASNAVAGNGIAGSRTAAQATAVRLALAVRDPAADTLVRTLLAGRVNGDWGCLCGNAQAVGALVDYLRAQPPPRAATVRVTLGIGETQTVQLTPVAPTRTLHFAGGAMQDAKSVKIDGTAPVSFALAYGYRLTGDVPGRYAGLRVDREIRAANTRPILAAMGVGAVTAPTLAAGRIFDVTVRITTDHDVDAVAIDDPLPAGLEAVDASFQTATKFYAPLAGSWSIYGRTIARDRVSAYAAHLATGSYELHYLVRSVTPGTYAWPGAEARLRYAANEFGRTAQTTLTVSP